MNAYRAWCGLARTALVFGCLTGLSELAGAATVNDGPGGFNTPFFTGTQSPDIDILSAALNLSGTNLLFSATMNGTIGTLPTSLYVLGIDRGVGSSNFGAVGLPGVIFDLVLTLTGTGTAAGRDTITNTPFSVPAGTFQISGSNITAVIPLSLVPLVAGGFSSADQYLWNFWTRDQSQIGNAALADFAPNNSDASVTPLPAALPLFASGGGLLGFLSWRRARKQAAIAA
jgi:hypothetical protein